MTCSQVPAKFQMLRVQYKKNTAGSGSKTAMTRRRYTTALSDRVCQSHSKRNSAQKEVFDVQFLTSVSHLFSV